MPANKTLQNSRHRFFRPHLLCCLCLLLCTCPAQSAPVEPAGDAAIAAVSDATAPMLSIGAHVVHEPEMRYWLKVMRQFYLQTHDYADITKWDVRQGGLPLREYLLQGAIDYACKNAAIALHSDALQVQLTQAQQQTLSESRQSNIRTYGSETEYARMVSALYGSAEVYEKLSALHQLSENLFARLYGENGEQCSDDCVNEHVRQQGFIAVKYIFRSALTAAGKPVSSTQRRRDQQLLGKLRSELSGMPGSAASELFDDLLLQYGQDAALRDYPDGRLFASGALAPELERAASQLAVNQFSHVVTTQQGSYLIMRMPVVPQMRVDLSGHSLRYWVAYESLFKPQVAAWCAALPRTADAGLQRLQAMPTAEFARYLLQ